MRAQGREDEGNAEVIRFLRRIASARRQRRFDAQSLIVRGLRNEIAAKDRTIGELLDDLAQADRVRMFQAEIIAELRAGSKTNECEMAQ
jgi:hypothetical protein